MGRAELPAAADRPVHYHDATRRPSSARALRDRQLKVEITRIHAEHFGVYGARKVWRQLHREGITVARCTVERLMRELGLGGAVGGKTRRTTTPDATAARPADLVDRDFAASDPTSCGSPISPMWRPGPALSMSPSSSMRSAASSWVGRPRGRCAPTWPWTPWRWLSGAAKPS
jgi:transposase InsO family protein